MIFKEEIKEQVSRIDERIKIDTIELSGYPKGKLLATSNNGRPVIYRVTYNKGKRQRLVITNDSAMISCLLRREYLEAELENLKKNKELILTLVDKMYIADNTTLMRNLMKKYPWMNDEQLKAAITSPDAGDGSWNSSPLNQNYFMEGSLRHVTSWGLRVRSKSEALIAEMLHRYNICFKYEASLDVDNGSVYPDFKIRRVDYKIIWWEHRGLMRNPEYSIKQHQKDIIYEGQGIVPWDNLILTYDNADGEINLKIVESMIKSRLLP